MKILAGDLYDRSIWATIPGQAFVSAALAETHVDESRGSFVIKDKNIQLVCDCQTVEDIRMINEFDDSFYDKDEDLSTGVDQKMEFNGIEYPALLITGRVYSFKKKKKMIPSNKIQENLHLLDKEPSNSARYWLLFDRSLKAKHCTSSINNEINIKFGNLIYNSNLSSTNVYVVVHIFRTTSFQSYMMSFG